MKQINLKEIIYTKSGQIFDTYPPFLQKIFFYFLNKLLHITEINSFLKQHNDKVKINFIDEVLEYLNFSYSVSRRDKDNIPSEGKLICFSNHPLGGLDGIILLKLISEVRKDIKIVVNDILLNIDNLEDLFLPYNIYSNKPQKENILNIQKSLKKEECIIIFPAGEVSRFGIKGIKDSKWNKGFLMFAEKYNVPLLPVYISARNSFLFYFVSFISKRLSMFLLPNELFNKNGKVAHIKIGSPIPQKSYNSGINRHKVQVKLLKKHLHLTGKGKSGIFKTEKNIIHPIDRKAVREQIIKSDFFAETEDGKKIYLIESKNSPDVMSEIARLRESTFRKVGEGTGKKLDLDEFDKLYSHIVLWDESELEIVGSYRLGNCERICKDFGYHGLYTNTLFNYSERFLGILPNAVELGRSFVQAKYWNTYALDYLWFGIGAYLVKHHEVKYLFGGVSLSNSYPDETKKLIIYFFKKWFGNNEKLVSAKNRFLFSDKDEKELYNMFIGDNYKQELLLLKNRLKVYGYAIPTLFKQYSELCEDGGTQFLDFGIDEDFQNCVDGLILVNIDAIKQSKKDRYLLRKKLVLHEV